MLTGQRTPSGKLAVTWPKCYADIPFGSEFGPYAPDADHALYREGIYVGYRYFDSFGVTPRYAFGYGKSYTDFSLETKAVELIGTDVQLSVTVANTGMTFCGIEVVQVYVSCPQGDLVKEFQRLAAFGKTQLLAPGASETLTLRFPLSTLSSYDEKTAETCLEVGNYILRVGDSSRNTVPAARLRLAERVALSRHRNLCAAVKTVQELQAAAPREEPLPADLTVLTIDPKLFRTVEYSHAPKQEALSEKTRATLDSFTAEDMVKFCAGTGLFGESRGFRVPGAVGHTTPDYLDRGIPNRELCDSPAESCYVRLQ
ncbi:MAG: fibronectin type III-like domain-contianing protein [Oscillospiraceae bacterium]|nr:fibronectin type III-like domain-contianing protein [Oscillospiraceae bacterium]